eukprot:m.1035847 g.1035847  ORF g.1035847 m.1035847 type:complete len:248 (+) comp24138_c3_seq37:284-1027(+)
MSEEQPLQKSETTVTAVNSAPSGTAESKTDASSNSCAQVKVEARGYLLKKCRTNGDNKPWKKRFFVLHGSSLLYYRGDNMAGAHKVLVILASDYTIKQGDAPPWNAKEAIPITIMDSTGRTFSVAATDTQAYEYWMAALAKGRHLPPADLPDQEYKYARSSATLRLRIGELQMECQEVKRMSMILKPRGTWSGGVHAIAALSVSGDNIGHVCAVAVVQCTACAARLVVAVTLYRRAWAAKTLLPCSG